MFGAEEKEAIVHALYSICTTITIITNNIIVPNENDTGVLWLAG